jgi:alkanesulfonate monooxygenase SsuD/methylene tetrahydromethanopterin reductase-like flavin-dependent oxidoreductase (luciferase family)
MARTKPVFGVGLDSSMAAAQDSLRLAVQADRQGLDHFSVSDHPYIADRFDAYAFVSVALGATSTISGFANVTNLPSRPAPMLARTVGSLNELTGGRVLLGMGAGGLWDEIAKLGVRKLDPAAAVRAFEEAIVLIRALSGGGAPVTFEGEFYQVTDLEPGAAPAPPVWTGSVGPRSLAVTGRQADGWIPGHAADWLSKRYLESRPIIDEAALAAGRKPDEIATVYNLPGAITDAPLANTRDRSGRWLGGSVDQWVEELTGAVLEHGAAGFTLFTPGGGHADEVMLGRWAQEIAPAVREAVQKAAD